ncbi:UNKNOWN [Stylonychia lemnae]|uniref:Homeobox domain-containing protein n=1 Tax=Stylonychia lemnae TaxID=5949 RepID=A0A078AD70_STYLE|nr:UNKNOWN [Stylonychia lemnae]|eukprot:CDW79477.1 UNKNOWN [Stylonychia lemnae]
MGDFCSDALNIEFRDEFDQFFHEYQAHPEFIINFEQEYYRGYNQINSNTSEEFQNQNAPCSLQFDDDHQINTFNGTEKNILTHCHSKPCNIGRVETKDSMNKYMCEVDPISDLDSQIASKNIQTQNEEDGYAFSHHLSSLTITKMSSEITVAEKNVTAAQQPKIRPKLRFVRQRRTKQQQRALQQHLKKSNNWDRSTIEKLSLELDLTPQQVYKWHYDRTHYKPKRKPKVNQLFLIQE